MIEPRIQTRPIYILICRRSQFTTDCDVALLCHRRCCAEIHRNQRGMVWSWSTLFTVATRWPSFLLLTPWYSTLKKLPLFSNNCQRLHDFTLDECKVCWGRFLHRPRCRVTPSYLIFVHSLFRFSHFDLPAARKLSRTATTPCILILLRCSRMKRIQVDGNAFRFHAVGTLAHATRFSFTEWFSLTCDLSYLILKRRIILATFSSSNDHTREIAFSYGIFLHDRIFFRA